MKRHSQPRQSLVILEQQFWQCVQLVPVESSKKEKRGGVGAGRGIQGTFQKALDSESEGPGLKS